LGGSFLIALGLVMQKHSHQQLRGWDASDSVYLKPWWLLGLLLYALGQVLNFVAMALAPQAVLGALGLSSVVFLAVLGWIALGESMRPVEVAGVLMVILAVPESKLPPHDRSTHEVAGSLAGSAFLLAAAVCAGAICLLWFSIVLFVPSRILPTAKGIFWTLVTGILSGYTVTLWKCASMLLLGARDTWVHWQMYVIMAIVCAMCVLQVHALNLALAMDAVMAVVPGVFSLGLLVSILNAQAAFEELSGMRRQALFWVGVVLVLASMTIAVKLQLSGDQEEAALEGGDSTAPLDKEKEEAADDEDPGPMMRKSQTMGAAVGPTQPRSRLVRAGRRHSTFFGLPNDTSYKGRIFPLGSGGLIVMT